MVFKLFLVLICGLHFGNFLFKGMDLWHGQGHFFQIGLLLIFCWSFFEKPRCVQVVNRPLGVFALWAGLTTSYLWFRAFADTQHYAIKIFLPFFNFLCFALFYKLSIEYLNKDKIVKILHWFRYGVVILLFYCVLQYFKLDEFLAGLSGKDELVGTLGNSSHLAGYLAIIQPIFFEKKLFNILALVLLWLIILLANSASGVLVGLAVIIFYLFMRKSKTCALSGLVSVSGIMAIILYKNPEFFSFSYRFEVWKLAFESFKGKAITGFGLGGFGLMKYDLKNPASYWRHAHNEYFQGGFELGLVGLGLILWCIWEYFRMFKTSKTDLTIKLAVMFLGFCLLSLFSFPAHLWLIAVVGMFSYSWLYVLKNEELIWQSEPAKKFATA